jgi:CDP-4-dehydro-6-deoxyglucose reductase
MPETLDDALMSPEKTMPRVTVTGTGVSVELREREPILAGLFRAGYAYRVGCKRGGCGACKVDLVDGEVEYPVTVSDTVLTSDERAAGGCLSCRAVPVTDSEIRLRNDDRLRCVAPFLAALTGGASSLARNRSTARKGRH